MFVSPIGIHYTVMYAKYIFSYFYYSNNLHRPEFSLLGIHSVCDTVNIFGFMVCGLLITYELITYKLITVKLIT